MDTWRDTQLQIEYAREEGVKEGEEKGERNGILKMAKNLIEMGAPMDDVVKASGLSANELSKLIS